VVDKHYLETMDTPDMNRVLAVAYRGGPFADALAVTSKVPPEDVEEFWNDTLAGMAAHPLKPGEYYAMIEE